MLTYYLEVHIYIGLQTLKVKCTQYGICSQAAFKNVRAMFFLKLGRSGNNFQSGQNFHGKVAPPGLDTPPRWKGGSYCDPFLQLCLRLLRPRWWWKVKGFLRGQVGTILQTGMILETYKKRFVTLDHIHKLTCDPKTGS